MTLDDDFFVYTFANTWVKHQALRPYALLGPILRSEVRINLVDISARQRCRPVVARFRNRRVLGIDDEATASRSCDPRRHATVALAQTGDGSSDSRPELGVFYALPV